jgi:uncharacterized membrane protein
VTAITCPVGIPFGFHCVDEAYQFQAREKTVKKNMGSADSKIRAFVVAPVLVVAGLLLGPAGWLAVVLYAVAVVMLVTAVVGTCPLYMLFGLRTCPLQNAGTPDAKRTVTR